MNEEEKIREVSTGITRCRKLLTALGDESRQHLILTMMQMGDCSGVRVVDVAAKTNLSRPAVSHHLQILKDAGLLKTRKEGTKIYYYFDPDMEGMTRLIRTLTLAVEITQALPDRSGEE
ncbi:ArsR/SmtB family transcription factor [Mobilibacterium timonense]|uniref:ArsR/SmtB family transcription factor n=1 Tax=Mobilibacterium timonense TaxID=1871012 RepID=UPI003A8FD99F